MSLTNTPQAKLLFAKMRHTQARQETASDNLARSGIAGAKSREVESFKKAVKRSANPSAIKATNAGHIAGSIKQTHYKTNKSKDQGPPSLTDNRISAPEQLLAFNEAVTDFYRLEQVNKNTKARIRMIAGIGGGK